MLAKQSCDYHLVKCRSKGLSALIRYCVHIRELSCAEIFSDIHMQLDTTMFTILREGNHTVTARLLRMK